MKQRRNQFLIRLGDCVSHVMITSNPASFINRDLTKAERAAEFERRQQNKQRRLQTLVKSQSGRRVEKIAMESTSSNQNQQIILNQAADKQLSASTPAFYPSFSKESVAVVVAASNDAAQIDDKCVPNTAESSDVHSSDLISVNLVSNGQASKFTVASGVLDNSQ